MRGDPVLGGEIYPLPNGSKKMVILNYFHNLKHPDQFFQHGSWYGSYLLHKKNCGLGGVWNAKKGGVIFHCYS